MLSKLARIIIVAKEVGGVDRMDFNMALNRLVQHILQYVHVTV